MREMFIINQVIAIILPGKCFLISLILFMLVYAAVNIVGYTYIQNGFFRIGGDIDIEVIIPHDSNI